MSNPATTRSSLPAKGAKLAPLSERLQRLGLVRDWDFVLHLPLRYEDQTSITKIADLTEGVNAQILGRVVASEVRRGRYEQLIAQVVDNTGEIQLRFLHFYPSTRSSLKEGALIRAYGQVRRDSFRGVWEMVHPKLKVGASAASELPSTLTPIYPSGEHITQSWLRKRIDRALLDVELTDLLPDYVTADLELPNFSQAVNDIHHPKPGSDIGAYSNRTAASWQRLKLDELFAQQITLIHGRRCRREASSHPLLGERGNYAKLFAASLPFELTGAQKRCSQEIAQDLKGNHPMHRLLQGDVGCGKTIVAAFACLQAIDSGFQAVLMAPTEILAEQHYQKLRSWFEPIGVRMLWLAGSIKPKDKAMAQLAIREGKVDLIVGTHAIIQDAVQFHRLGLAVVDEQHRFGVAQRLKLRALDNAGCVPHMLMLSATPIPRTLAMTYLADIDISVINELPKGRTPIATKLVSLTRINEVINAIHNAVRDKRQCYWVCPLIEESEKAQLTAATLRYESLKDALEDVRVGLVHGSMTAEEKQAVMSAFAAGELDVLVATIVIEVGVDVPNASVMVIEHAERFGLSQLHQLRGRVGRGRVRSACILLFDPELSDTGKSRLRVIHHTTDGFEIAREDLKLRGPGEFLGARQSGVPALRFSDLENDSELIEIAKRKAGLWLERDPENALRHAKRWFTPELAFLDA